MQFEVKGHLLKSLICVGRAKMGERAMSADSVYPADMHRGMADSRSMETMNMVSATPSHGCSRQVSPLPGTTCATMALHARIGYNLFPL